MMRGSDSWQCLCAQWVPVSLGWMGEVCMVRCLAREGQRGSCPPSLQPQLRQNPPLSSPHLSHPPLKQPCLIICSLGHHSPPSKGTIVGNTFLPPRAGVPWPGRP